MTSKHDEKLEILRKLGDLYQCGTKLSKNFCFSDDLESMQKEYDYHISIKKKIKDEQRMNINVEILKYIYPENNISIDTVQEYNKTYDDFIKKKDMIIYLYVRDKLEDVTIYSNIDKITNMYELYREFPIIHNNKNNKLIDMYVNSCM